MGCFPQKIQPRYHSLPPQRGRLLKKSYNNDSRNIDSINFPININQQHTVTRGNRSYNYSPVKKKAVPFPINNRNNYSDRFKRKQLIDKSYEKDRRQLNGKGRNEEMTKSIQRREGTVIELPFRQHIITKIVTPSESVKSSVLSLLEHNPSVLFTKLKDKDIQKVFSPSKYNENMNDYNLNKSLSPKRSSSISLLHVS